MADNWRDQHRRQGKFVPRPGAKGFRLPVAEPEPDDCKDKRPPNTLALWVDKNRQKK
jgi:hypothetical protein